MRDAEEIPHIVPHVYAEFRTKNADIPHVFAEFRIVDA